MKNMRALRAPYGKNSRCTTRARYRIIQQQNAPEKEDIDISSLLLLMTGKTPHRQPARSSQMVAGCTVAACCRTHLRGHVTSGHFLFHRSTDHHHHANLQFRAGRPSRSSAAAGRRQEERALINRSMTRQRRYAAALRTSIIDAARRQMGKSFGNG